MVPLSCNHKERTEFVYNTFKEYNTDKANHGYSPIYAIVPSTILSVLEIGVADFPSMHAWLDIFPVAQVTGLDIKINKEKRFEHERLICIESDINKFKPNTNYDLIIDDGSHDPKDVIAGWQNLKNHCNGWYIIEDIKYHKVQDIINVIHEDDTRLKLVHMVQVRPNGNSDSDDRMIVVQFKDFLS